MTSILIVEDDITYGMMLKAWLGKQGFRVATAGSIDRAQKQIETEAPDVCPLMDMEKPNGELLVPHRY